MRMQFGMAAEVDFVEATQAFQDSNEATERSRALFCVDAAAGGTSVSSFLVRYTYVPTTYSFVHIL